MIATLPRARQLGGIFGSPATKVRPIFGGRFGRGRPIFGGEPSLRFDKSRFFFDKPLVMRLVDEARRKNLSRAGAFIRQTARKSMRRAPLGRYSQPGNAPFAHGLAQLKNRLFFAYDPILESVVIGPEELGLVSFGVEGEIVRGTVPETLEYGGSMTIVQYLNRQGRWRRLDRRLAMRTLVKREYGEIYSKVRQRKVRILLRRRNITFEPRPFMGPAYEKEKPHVTGLWADSIHERN